MNNRQIDDVTEDNAGIDALRRRYLVDLAWPESTDALCRWLGLQGASDDVQEAEHTESDARMRRFADDDVAVALLVSAAADMEVILRAVDTAVPEERISWLATFALACINLLESQGKLAVS